MKTTSALIAAGVLTLGTTAICSSDAHAQWYVSGNGGVGFQSDSDFTDTFAGGNAAGTSSFDTGFAFTGAVGYAWGGLRLEAEAGYRQNDLDQMTVDSITVGGALFTGLGSFDVSGDTSALSMMVNGWYDFNTGTNWVPFIGGGIGAARVNLSVDSIAGTSVSFDESDTVFAYQFGAGIGYKLTPGTMISLSYRFFGTSDPQFDDGTDQIEGEYQNHSVMVGFLARF